MPQVVLSARLRLFAGPARSSPAHVENRYTVGCMGPHLLMLHRRPLSIMRLVPRCTPHDSDSEKEPTNMENALPSVLDKDQRDETLQEYAKQAREIQEAAAERAAIMFPGPPRRTFKWEASYNNS